MKEIENLEEGEQPMHTAIRQFDGRIAKIVGPAQSGKTEALVQRAAALLRNSVNPENILVETSTAFAAQAFRARLSETLGDDCRSAAEIVRICTPLEECVRVLDSPDARVATGRTPRILAQAEYNFFLEDMKTLGIARRKLRSMLTHFYRCMADDKPQEQWRLGGEEEAALERLRAILVSRDAMLEQEASWLASAFLRSDEGALSRKAYDFVLCDDYQNMSRAQQNCFCLLAKTQLIVAGNPNETLNVATDLPCPQGFEQFDTLRRKVTVFSLKETHGNPAVARMCNALCSCADMDSSLSSQPREISANDEARFSCVKWNSPEDELNGMTKYLRVLADETPNVRESRMCIVVPNRQWAAMAKRMLEKRGFSVSTAGAQAGIYGNPYDLAKAGAVLAYTKLTLLANPEDMTAWRSWCGMGNQLTNSDAWAFLEQYAQQRGLSLYEALRASSEEEHEPFLRAHVLTQRWTEGQHFIQAHAKRRGFALLHAIGADALESFEEVSRAMIGDETPRRLLALTKRCLIDPRWPDDAHTIHVAAAENLCGTCYDSIFFLGLIDGFTPCRDAFEIVSTDAERESLMNSERRKFASALAKAQSRAVLSFFGKADLELAERTKMQVTRIRSEEGARIAILRPSAFLLEGENAAPSTTGGQALLASYELN